MGTSAVGPLINGREDRGPCTVDRQPWNRRLGSCLSRRWEWYFAYYWDDCAGWYVLDDVCFSGMLCWLLATRWWPDIWSALCGWKRCNWLTDWICSVTFILYLHCILVSSEMFIWRLRGKLQSWLAWSELVIKRQPGDVNSLPDVLPLACCNISIYDTAVYPLTISLVPIARPLLLLMFLGSMLGAPIFRLWSSWKSECGGNPVGKRVLRYATEIAPPCCCSTELALSRTISCTTK